MKIKNRVTHSKIKKQSYSFDYTNTHPYSHENEFSIMKFNIFSEILVVYGITVRADCHRYNARYTHPSLGGVSLGDSL